MNCNYALYCYLNSSLNFGDMSNTRKSGESIGRKNGAISKSFAVYSELVDAQFSTVAEVCFFDALNYLDRSYHIFGLFSSIPCIQQIFVFEFHCGIK